MFRNIFSLSAKLFYLTTMLVILTAGSLAFYSGQAFIAQSEEQARENLLNLSQDRGRDIENLIGNLDTYLRLGLKEVLSIPQDKREQAVNNFVKHRVMDEFIGFQLFKKNKEKVDVLAEEFTSDLTDHRFEDKNPDTIIKNIRKNTLRWLSREVKRSKKSSFMFRSFHNEFNLPIFVLARSVKDKKSNDVYLGTLIVWGTSVLEKTTKIASPFLRTFLLYRNKQVVSSSNRKDLKRVSSVVSLQIVKDARKVKQRSYYNGGYKDIWGKDWLGAYYRLEKYGLTFFAQQDASSAYRTLIKLVWNFVWVTLLLILIAIFISYYGSAGLTANLRSVIDMTKRIAGGDFTTQVPVKGHDEIGVLSSAINIMSTQIQQLLVQETEKVKLEKELETASYVQETIFPVSSNIEIGPMKLTWFTKPASECGGDWCGHFTAKEGVEFIFIADAMGHGVPAALVTTMACSCCSTLAKLIKEDYSTLSSPGIILERFNEVLTEIVNAKISMTFYVLKLDFNEGVMTYANGGHNFPILIPKDSEDSRITMKTKKYAKISPRAPINLKQSGAILGVSKDVKFKEKSMPIKAGDKIFLYTDGIIECENPKNKPWGKNKLVKNLLANFELSAEELNSLVVRSAYEFFEGVPQDDDITTITISVDEGWKPIFERKNDTVTMSI